MKAFFDRLQFLEFFDQEKIYDEQLGSYKYSIELEKKFLIEVSMNNTIFIGKENKTLSSIY